MNSNVHFLMTIEIDHRLLDDSQIVFKSSATGLEWMLQY